MFTVGVVATTIFWSVGVAALVPAVANAEGACPTLVAGDMVKVAGRAAIYAIDNNLKTRYFDNGDVFKSWRPTYGGYKTITMACLDYLGIPSVAPYGVAYHSGSYIAKRASSDQLYAVLPTNTLSKITTSAAQALYGATYKTMTISDQDWPNYPSRGSDITEGKVHAGMTVKNGGKTWYVNTDLSLSEVSAEGVTANGFQTKFTYNVADSAVSGFATGAAITAAVPALVDKTQSGGTTGATVVGGVTAGALSVSLASDTPATGGYALADATRVPFTKVTFTAGSSAVTVDSIQVKREGFPAIDGNFLTINVVTPEGSLLNDSGKTFNSDHVATFTEDLTIPANSSRTYTLVGNMAAAAATTDGDLPKLSLTAVVSNAASVSGLPVTGNALIVNESLTLSDATLQEGAVVGTVTKQVGATNVLLASMKVSNTTGGSDADKITVEKLTFYNAGTVSDSDITSYKLKYNSNTIGTANMVNKYVNFDLAACGTACTFEKGFDHTFELYADLTGGSGRTVNLDVQYVTHAVIKDVDNNVYITPTYTGTSAASMSNTITISQGKLNVTKVNNVPAGNIPANASNLELASWNFNVVGEPIDIRTLVFKITTTGTIIPTGIDSLILYNAAGKALTGSHDGAGAASPGNATSTDTFTLPPGDNILTLKGKVDSTAVANDTIAIAVDMRNDVQFIAKGVNSSLTITLGTYATPQSQVAANTKTVKTSALAVTTLSSPAARTYAPGTSGVEFATVMLDASASTEDIKVSQLTVLDTTNSTALTIDIQNIRIWVDKDGDSYNGSGTAVSLSEVVSGADSDAGDDETLTFNLSGDDQFVVKAGKKLVFSVKGDIAGGATAGTHTFSTATADDVVGTGQTTNTQVTETVDTAAGQAMTVGVAGGQLEVSLASDNPTAKQFAAGTSVTLAAFRFLATTTEDVEVDYMYLSQVVSTTVSSSFKDYDQIWFADAAGNEIAGTRMSPTSTKPYVDFADNAFIVPATGAAKVLYLKAKLATIGSCASLACTGANGVPANQLGYSVRVVGDIVAKGDLSGTGSTEFFGTTVPNGTLHYVYKSYPVITRLSTDNAKLGNGTEDLFKFKITAVNGDVALGGFTFDISTTTATVAASTLYLYDVTETQEEQINITGGTGTYYGTGAIFQTVGHADDWDTTQTNDEVLVSVAQPHTFVLRGNITGAATGASITTGIAGDAAAITGINATNMLSASNVDSQTNDDFIWSDVSDQSHSDATTDWTNGYLVSGLSSSTSTLETIAF